MNTSGEHFTTALLIRLEIRTHWYVRMLHKNRWCGHCNTSKLCYKTFDSMYFILYCKCFILEVHKVSDFVVWNVDKNLNHFVVRFCVDSTCLNKLMVVISLLGLIYNNELAKTRSNECVLFVGLRQWMIGYVWLMGIRNYGVLSFKI